jgi:hypothetical protein
MFKRFLLAMMLVVTGTFLPLTGAHAAECSAYEQSHPNFLLDGSHLSTGKCSTCASCHLSGVFMGTPKNCVACHNGDPKYTTVARSAAHIPTQVIECNNCHFTSSFQNTWSMNHAVLGTARCDTCHSGGYLPYNAQKKTQNHIPTTADCGTCHTTPGLGSSFPVTAWDTVSHEQIHMNITTGCVTCHDNVIAKGKAAYTPGHPVTSEQCEQCHSINAAFKCAELVDKTRGFASLFIQKARALFA